MPTTRCSTTSSPPWRPTCCNCTAARRPERVAAVKARYGLPVMKAFSIRDAADLAAIEPYRGVADRFLFDAKPPKGVGTAGRQRRVLRLARCWRRFDPARRLHAFRRAQRRQYRRGAARWPARPASTSRPASKARRASRMSALIEDFFRAVAMRARKAPPEPIRCHSPAKRLSESRWRPAAQCRRNGNRHEQADRAQFLPHRTRRAGHVRHVRRPLRRRDADAADPRPARRTGTHAKTDPAFKAELDASQHALYRPAEPALFRRAADRSISAARRSISSATSSTTPARTRSTTASARSCSPSAWARRASSPRPAPASTAWPRPRSRRASACPASSTWARPTSSGRRRTCSA